MLVRDHVPPALKNEIVTMCVCTVGVCMYDGCVCVCVCVYECFGNRMGVLVIRVLALTVFLHCFVYVYLFLFVTSVRTTSIE